MRHLSDARKAAEQTLTKFLSGKAAKWRLLLIEDVSARLRAILWCPKNDWESAREDVDRMLRGTSGAYWSQNVLRGRAKEDQPDGPWQADAWENARNVEGTSGLRILERHRAKTGWFEAPGEPPWRIGKDEPPIGLFYSFKGGVGRSTALAAAALHLAGGGDRVVVLDADLDAPGLGSLLTGHDGSTASWGIVDYLLEKPILDENGGLELKDYYHRCPPSLVSGSGEIVVFPAGAFDGRYVDKLARIDYGAQEHPEHPFVSLLKQIRRDLAPHWILVDARAGLGDVSGFLTGGVCHLHVLLGTLADASWRGMELILDRLGGERVRRGDPQAECVLVAAMLPRSQERLYHEAVERFTDRARDVFSESYYAEPEERDRFWTLDDLESNDAPHVPVVLPYDERLAVFRDLSEVADSILLKEEPYKQLVEHLRASLKRLQGSSR